MGWFETIITSSVFVAIVSGWFYECVLGSASARESLANAISPNTSGIRRYRRIMIAVLKRARRFFGPHPFGLRALNRCQFIAFAYPTALLLLSWLLSGSATADKYEMFPSDWPHWKRLLALLLLVLYLFGIWWHASRFKRSADWLKDRIESMLNRLRLAHHNTPRIQLAIPVVTYVLLYTGTIAFTSTFAVTGISAGFGIIAVPFAFAGFHVIAGVGAGVGVIAIISVIASLNVSLIATIGIVISIGTSGGAHGTLFILLYVVLPTLNGFFDWISLGASRKLLGGLVGRTTLKAAIVHVLLDLLIAALFLLLLAVALGFVLELTSQWTAVGDDRLDWRAYVESVMHAPLGAGLMVTVMLASTLLPTLGHFALALFAIPLQAFAPWRRWLYKSLQGKPNHFTKGAITAVVLLELAIVGAVIVLPIWLAIQYHTPASAWIGNELKNAAFASGDVARSLFGDGTAAAP